MSILESLPLSMFLELQLLKILYSLVTPWLRIHLAMQYKGNQFIPDSGRSTCHAVTKSMHHTY